MTRQQVIDVIFAVERRHRVVWTAGRVLKEDGSLHRVMTGAPAARRRTLLRIRHVLKDLARTGMLTERAERQLNYGVGKETSYDLAISVPPPATEIGSRFYSASGTPGEKGPIPP